ncbi:MAG: hypothetical protein IKH12_03790 [Clostridia bacterium]|nr:hypothetical protein [Clostridia bacterium]
MAIQQISVFVENQKGKLLGTVKALAEAGINIRALSIADTKDFGILRLITSDNQKAMEVLSQDSVVNTTRVIAAKMEDEAGALYKVLQILSDAQINIEYIYAFAASDDFGAYVVLRVSDVAAAQEILNAHGVSTLDDKDIVEL